MSVTRAKYKLELWLPRALAFAKALKGRPLSDDEAEYLKECGQDWPEYFRVFGFQPDTQLFIDGTIKRIQEMIIDESKDLGKYLVLGFRLRCSAKETKGKEAK